MRLQSVHSWPIWNQALNEVRIPYLLARVFGMKIKYLCPRPGARTPDIQATGSDIALNVEIKTPGQGKLAEPGHAFWLGRDTGSIVQALKDANGQFAHGECNLLAIGAQLLEERRISEDNCVFEALYGHEAIAGKIDTRTGNAVGEPYAKFIRDGKMQHNRFTRVAAVMIVTDGQPRVGVKRARRMSHQYHCAIFHNAYSKVKLPQNVFYGTRQLVFSDSGQATYVWPEGSSYTFWGY